MNNREKVRLCAEFLVRCLAYGWSRKDLDELQQIWWDYKGWEHSGVWTGTPVTILPPEE